MRKVGMSRLKRIAIFSVFILTVKTSMFDFIG